MPETANTTTILIRFFVAIDIVDALPADHGLGFDFLRFAFVGVVLADIEFEFPGYGGQAVLRPDPDAFPVEVCPRSATTIACFRTRRLNGTGKPKLTEIDGL